MKNILCLNRHGIVSFFHEKRLIAMAGEETPDVKTETPDVKPDAPAEGGNPEKEGGKRLNDANDEAGREKKKLDDVNRDMSDLQAAAQKEEKKEGDAEVPAKENPEFTAAINILNGEYPALSPEDNAKDFGTFATDIRNASANPVLADICNRAEKIVTDMPEGKMKTDTVSVLKKMLVIAKNESMNAKEKGSQEFQDTQKKLVDEANSKMTPDKWSTMSDRAKDVYKAQLMMKGLSVTDNGVAEAPENQFMRVMNIIGGLMAFIELGNPFKKKESKSEKETTKSSEKNGTEKSAEASVADADLVKEIKDDSVSGVITKAENKKKAADEVLNGTSTAVPPVKGLLKHKEEKSADQARLAAQKTAKEADLGRAKDDQKPAIQAEINTLQGQIDALKAEITTLDANIALQQNESSKAQKKLDDVKRIADDADTKTKDIDQKVNDLKTMLGGVAYASNPEAKIILNAFRAHTLKRGPKLEMEISIADPADWEKMVTLGLEKGIDRDAFKRKGKELVSPDAFKKAIESLQAMFTDKTVAADKNFKEFRDKGAKEADAKEASKLNEEYPGLNLTFDGIRFSASKNADIQVVRCYKEKSTLSTPIRSMLLSHINDATKDLSDPRAEKVISTWFSNYTDDWSDPKIAEQLVQLKKEGANVTFALDERMEESKIVRTPHVSISNAKQTPLYKSGTLTKALKNYIG